MASKKPEQKSEPAEALVPRGATGVQFGKTTAQEAIDQTTRGSAARRGYQVAPKVMSFKEPGQWIEGRLDGEGATIEVEDIATGEVRSLKSWVFSGGSGLRIALMGTYQLDHELPLLVGKMVRVTYLQQVETRKAQRVKDYLIESWDADAALEVVA